MPSLNDSVLPPPVSTNCEARSMLSFYHVGRAKQQAANHACRIAQAASAHHFACEGRSNVAHIAGCVVPLQCF